MALPENLSLHWNDFESNISKAFQELRETKDFFDVTLVCDEDQIHAHKIILSACSPFFKTVLRRSPQHKHPLIYLKDVKLSELTSLLDFIYMGEVIVNREDLNSFLLVAEDLKVKGLSTISDSKSSRPIQPQDVVVMDQLLEDIPPSPEKSRFVPSNLSVMNGGESEDLKLRIEDLVKSERTDEQVWQRFEILQEQDMHDGKDEYNLDHEFIFGETQDMNGGHDEDAVAHVISSKMYQCRVNGKTFWQCAECEFGRAKKSYVKRHVESKHSGLEYRCNICGAVFGLREAFRFHMRKKHFSVY